MKLPLCIMFCLVAASSVFAGEIDIFSIRNSGMGGPHVALVDDRASLFTNPAGFRSAPPTLGVAELAFHLSGPVFTIANAYLTNSGGGDAVPPGLLDEIAGLNTSFGFIGPLSFSYVGEGLGLGLFNDTRIDLKANRVGDVIGTAKETTFLGGGYSFRLPIPSETGHIVDLGMLLKGYVLGEVEVTSTMLEIESLFSDPASILMQEPFALTRGIGADLGIYYSYDHIFAAGLSLVDVYTYSITTDYTTLDGFIDDAAAAEVGESGRLVPLNVTYGMLFRPPIVTDTKIISDWILVLDYSDIFDFLLQPATATNPILHLGMGTEVTFLEIIDLRLGVYQALLNAGLGLDLQLFKLNFAVFGRELGMEPGLNPVYNIEFGLEFSY